MDGVTSDLLTSGAAELLHTAWRERERRQGEREKRGGVWSTTTRLRGAEPRTKTCVPTCVLYMTQGLDTPGTKTKSQLTLR